MRNLPVAEPDLSGNERAYVLECIETAWVSSAGHFITDFEEAFARYCGTEHALAVSNGTVALHLAMTAMGIGPGDEVIVPDLTFAACANAVVHAGATPVFADIDPASWNLDPARVEACITERTKAIMAVHLYGNPCDLDALCALKEEHGLYLIEDAAEAHGARYGGRPAGSFGDVSCFSFYGNKTITSGEGGMCLTSDPALQEAMSRLRDHGMDPERRYWHDRVGYNYRMTNLQAAVGLAQLERLDEFVEKKRRIAQWYRQQLEGAGFAFPAVPEEASCTYWLTSVLLPEGTDRTRVQERLREVGIDTRPFFYPMHVLPPFAQDGSFGVSESVSARGLNLPSGVTLGEDDVAYAAHHLIEAAGKEAPSSLHAVNGALHEKTI